MIIQERQKILVVDDERVNRKVLSELLSEKYHIIVAKSGLQTLDRIRKNNDIDLILLDVMMPEMNGYDVIKHLKNDESTKDIPVIFITALNSTEEEERGLHLGASDYITKPFHPAIVKLRVENHLCLVRQRKLLEKLVGCDGLTEIANRRSLDETLEKEWNSSSRNGLSLSLAMVDVDFFKPFNDNYGHARGDQVLKSVARVLSCEMRRPADFAARYGGEEFVLLFPNTDTDAAIERAEIIRTSIEDMNIPHEYSSVASCVTVSIGGATGIGSRSSQDSLLIAADTMLYKAKAQGRNRTLWEK